MDEELKFCDSTLNVNDGIVRCQLPFGHEGSHSVKWDAEDGMPLEPKFLPTNFRIDRIWRKRYLEGSWNTGPTT